MKTNLRNLTLLGIASLASMQAGPLKSLTVFTVPEPNAVMIWAVNILAVAAIVALLRRRVSAR